MGFPILAFLIGVFNFFIVLYFLAADSVLEIFKKIYIKIKKFGFVEILLISRSIAAIDCIKEFNKIIDYLSILNYNAAINYIKKFNKNVNYLIIKDIKIIIIKGSIAAAADIKPLIN